MTNDTDRLFLREETLTLDVLIQPVVLASKNGGVGVADFDISYLGKDLVKGSLWTRNETDYGYRGEQPRYQFELIAEQVEALIRKTLTDLERKAEK